MRCSSRYLELPVLATRIEFISTLPSIGPIARPGNTISILPFHPLPREAPFSEDAQESVDIGKRFRLRATRFLNRACKLTGGAGLTAINPDNVNFQCPPMCLEDLPLE
jgi:hypothetical protein